MSITHINYTLKKKKIFYKNVSVVYNNLQNKKSFDSGSFVKDWYDSRKFLIKEIPGDEFHCNSSDVDQFFRDGALFDSAYLKIINSRKFELKYVDRSNQNWFMNPDLKGIEFFVQENTKPTWSELRKIVGDIKTTSS